MSCMGSVFPQEAITSDVPTWVGMRSLFSESKVPIIQVGFLPFLPHPVREYSTVCTAMKNYTATRTDGSPCVL